MSDSINTVSPSPKSDRGKEHDNNLVFSYMSLRNLIGFSGMLLPFVLMIFTKKTNGEFVKPSISDYYYTGNGDILVVLLSVLGVFLFTYKGYNWKEKALTTIAAICALGVAFSPMASVADIADTEVVEIAPNSIHTAINFGGDIPHGLFAGLFFISVAIISLKYFPRSDAASTKKPDGKKTAKEKRNIVYRICGWTMLACVFILAMYFLIKPFEKLVGGFPIIFALETVAIVAFGISWLTKGETLWPDGKHYMVKAYEDAKNSMKR